MTDTDKNSGNGWRVGRRSDDYTFYSNPKFEKYVANPNGTRNSVKIHVSQNVDDTKTHVTLEIMAIKDGKIIEKKYYYYPYNNSFSFDVDKGKVIAKMLISTWIDYCKELDCSSFGASA